MTGPKKARLASIFASLATFKPQVDYIYTSCYVIWKVYKFLYMCGFSKPGPQGCHLLIRSFWMLTLAEKFSVARLKTSG